MPLPPSLRLGGLFPNSGSWTPGPSVYPAFKLAISEINANPLLLPDTVLNYYVNDSACDENVGLAALLGQNEHPRNIDAVIGDGCSAVSPFNPCCGELC